MSRRVGRRCAALPPVEEVRVLSRRSQRVSLQLLSRVFFIVYRLTVDRLQQCIICRR